MNEKVINIKNNLCSIYDRIHGSFTLERVNIVGGDFFLLPINDNAIDLCELRESVELMVFMEYTRKSYLGLLSLKS